MRSMIIAGLFCFLSLACTAAEPLRVGTADTLIELVDRLEEIDDVRELIKPLLN